MLLSALAVCAGASCGALLRWLLGMGLNGLFPAIPCGTLVANILGAFLMGLALCFFALRADLPPQLWLFIGTGFLGGLTTFSTFSGEVALMLQQGRMLVAGATIALHVGGSLAATFLGMASFALARGLLRQF